MLSPKPSRRNKAGGKPRGRRRACFTLGVVELEDRTLLSSGPSSIGNDLAQAALIPLASEGSTTEPGHLAGNNDLDFFQIHTPADGLLIAKLHPELMTTRLSLLDSQGQLLMQSDGLSLGNPDDLIEMHLTSGTYFLEVQSTSGAGDYALTTSLTPTYDPYQQLGDSSVYNEPLAVGDFNSDGIPDLATPNVLYLGVGDGTFQNPPIDYNLSGNGNALISGDFNGDGKTDLVVANSSSDTVSVFLGNGDGTFQTSEQYEVGDGPSALVAGDFNGDGRLDLAVANQADDTVSVLMGNGNGTFQSQVTYAVGSSPVSIVAGDFTGDGRLDLAVANQGDDTVSVLLNNGYGAFQPQVTYAVGSSPSSIVAGDFAGNGRLDLAVANTYSNDISMLMGNGNGIFQPQVTYAVGDEPAALVAGDFNGDGRLDLAVANMYSNDISVLMGNGTGTFQPQERFAAGNGPSFLVEGDFNGGGRLDLAVANLYSNNISVLLGNGDGTFYGQASDQIPVGALPNSSVAGDFNGDGRLDLATADALSNEVSVLLGNGDGTFQEQGEFPVGNDPTALVAGDFNDDGRLDLAVVNAGDGTVSVLLGNGDGTFRSQLIYAVGDDPDAIVAGDFNGDGDLDLAVANQGDGTVSVLMGNGNGTFQPQVTYAVGDDPAALVAGDFNGDGRLDLAVANEFDGTVSVLMNHGNGTFQPQVTYPVGDDPSSIVAGDFNGDGRLDLAVANAGDGTVSVLMNNGSGAFQPQATYTVGALNGSLVTGDFNGDGQLDLAIANGYSGTVSVLIGNGDGTFQEPETFGVGTYIDDLVTGDFNGDGLFDLAVISPDPNTIPVLMSNGNGTFATANLFATTPDNTPVVADLNGDGIDDVLVIDAAGDILYRQGQAPDSTSFAPPITINPGFPSRGIAFLPQTDQGPLIASVDARDNAISFYAWRHGGFVRLYGSLTTGQLPAQILAADLNNDGRDELVVRNAGDGTISVFLGTAFNPSKVPGPYNPQLLPPSFLAPVILTTGLGASDVAAIDTTGSRMLDLVVTNQVTGQVSLLRNQGNGTFASPTVYRGGAGLSSVDDSSGSPQVLSLEDTAGVAAGPLTAGGPTDLVTINPGSNTLDVLAGLGQGRFANPVALPTPEPARVIRMADFNHDGILDLAILTANGVDIELGNGHGGFLPPVSYDAGSDPTGLTIADINHDGNPDLLVSNPFGDLLVLLGQRNGTFQPYRNTNQTITLAVADLTRNGSKDIIYADQGLDQVVVDYGAGDSTVLGDRSTGLLDPGAVTLADLNGDGIPDLIVANSGSNNVLIYPGLGNGQFGPAVNGGHGYFVGTNPVGITVADLTGEMFPDGEPRLDLVVANKGSNDVSILLNQGDFHFTQGPRLKPGGSGPVSTVVGHFTGDAYPDLLVTDSGSNDVRLLPGVGQGFFNDTNPIIYAVGTNPVTSFVGNFAGQTDLVTVNAGSNNLTLISGFNGPAPVTTTIPSGGTDPMTAFAFPSGGGFESLVVGNAGDGVLALFEGGTDGLVLTSRETVRDLPNPSDLSFSVLTDSQVLFYAVTEGREIPILVALSLIGNSASPTPAPLLNDIVQLVSLQESSLSLVGTLLTLTIDPPTDEINLVPIDPPAISAGAFFLGMDVSVGQSLTQRGGNDIESGLEDEAGNPANDTAGLLPSGSSTRERFILGLDEALEQFGRENRDRFSSNPDAPSGTSQPRIGSGPQPTTPERPSSFRQVPAQGEAGHRPGRMQDPRSPGRVDAILDSLGADDTHSDRSSSVVGFRAGEPLGDAPLDRHRREPRLSRFARNHSVPSRTAISASRAAVLLIATWTFVGSAGGIARFRSRFTPDSRRAPVLGGRGSLIAERALR